jgi:hypothetical protein
MRGPDGWKLMEMDGKRGYVRLLNPLKVDTQPITQAGEVLGTIARPNLNRRAESMRLREQSHSRYKVMRRSWWSGLFSMTLPPGDSQPGSRALDGV